MKIKGVAYNVLVDADQAVLVLDTPGEGCYGIYKAPAVRGGVVQPEELCVYLETNGDPVLLPVPSDVHGEESLAIVLADAGLSRERLDAALDGVAWWS